MIERVREMVDRALTWLVNRAVDTGLALLDRAMAFGRAAVESLLSWLGIRNDFRSADGGEHHIILGGSETNPVLMVASNNPTPVERFLETKLEANSLDEKTRDAHTYYTGTVKIKETDVETKSRTYYSIPGDRRDEKRAARYAHQVAVQELRIIMQTFAGKLSQVNFAGGDPNLQQRTIIDKTRDNGRAKNVTAWPLTYLPGNDVGGPPSQNPPGWRGYAQDSSEQWVRGHLLSERLHGPGLNWNLVPLIQTVNSNMETVEATVEPLISQQGKLHYYIVDANYDDTNRTTDNEKAIPRSISIQWGELRAFTTVGNVADKLSTHTAGPFDQELPNFGGPPNLNVTGEEVLTNKGIPNSLARDIRNCKNRYLETHGGFADLADLIDKMEKFYARSLTLKPDAAALSQERRNSSLTSEHRSILTRLIATEHKLEIKI
jgi:hypothetical protein